MPTPPTTFVTSWLFLRKKKMEEIREIAIKMSKDLDGLSRNQANLVLEEIKEIINSNSVISLPR